MPNITTQILSLLFLVESETDERALVREGSRGLEELRRLWRDHKSEYSEENIAQLRLVAEQIEAVRQFIEEEEEFEYIKDRDEVDEVIARLYPLVEATSKMAVAGRIQKEIRELLERRATMPSKAKLIQSAARAQAIRRLTTDAPVCKAHEDDHKMVLREGPFGFFWGCPTFPNCWHRKQLTHKEQAQLDV